MDSRSWCWLSLMGIGYDIREMHTYVTPQHILFGDPPVGFVYQGYAGLTHSLSMNAGKSPTIPGKAPRWWATEGDWLRAGANTVPSLEASMMLSVPWTLKIGTAVWRLWKTMSFPEGCCFGHQVHFLDHWWTQHCTFSRKRQSANVVEVITLLSLFVLIVGC